MLLDLLRRKTTIKLPISRDWLQCVLLSLRAPVDSLPNQLQRDAEGDYYRATTRVLLSRQILPGVFSQSVSSCFSSFETRLVQFVAFANAATRKCLTECKILKQIADRFYYDFHSKRRGAFQQSCVNKLASFEGRRILLSESEAKFFLDRYSQRKYVDRKFFGRVCARAKFHLLDRADSLNCRTYSGGGITSSASRTSARCGKAESRKQGLTRIVDRLTKASGKKRLLGLFLFPADMEEGKFRYELESEQCGRKGGWSYCVIS